MITIIPVISLFVFGYCCIWWEGMILGKIGNWMDERLPEWIAKPLYQCYICKNLVVYFAYLLCQFRIYV